MRKFGKSLAVVAVIGLVGGQAYAQGAPITVRDAPIHKVPDEPEDAPAAKAKAALSTPVEDNAPPDTLNAQFAAQSHSALLTKVSDPAPLPVSEAPKPESPAVSAKPEAKEVEGPSTPIATRIIDAAGAFESYMRHASLISSKFSDGASVAKAMATGSAYEIQQFQEGAAAYGALVALQDPAFVQGVFNMSRDPRDRAAMTEQLLAHPDSVLDIDGAEEAGAMVGAVLAKMGVDLVHAGQGVKQAAYSVQSQSWSKEDVAHADQRLAQAKAVSAIKTSLNPADTEALIKTIVALRKAEGQTSPGRGGEPTPIVQHGLAIAALAVMGRAGDAQIARVAPLLSDAKSADCMKMAKLNLYQCMAAAGPEYEDVFCLGAHAMIDTGQCLISASGQTPIPEGALQKASVPTAPVVRTVSVPIALMSTEGPERARARVRVPESAAPAPPPADEIATEDASPPPAAAPRDYAPAARDYAAAPRDYAEAPRAPSRARAPAPREDAYDDRADQGYDRYADPYADRYAQPRAPQRRAYRDDYREQPDYANAYGAYGYGR